MTGNAIYLLRTVHQHHVALSALADQKASFLLGGTIVILGFVATANQQASIGLPFLVLAAGSVLALVFCCLTLIPRIRFHDPKQPGFNLLFCSHFINLSEDEFIRRMKATIDRDASISEALSRDIYQMGGIIVRRKLKTLRFAYGAFLAGIIACVVGCVLQAIF